MSEEEKRIIWLASYPKSGNTWFRIFLIHLLSGPDNPFDINDLRQIPIASSRNIFDQYTGQHSSDLSFEEISSLQPEVFKKISRENTQDLFFKTHDAWTLNKEGKPLFPQEISKGVIYIIRNPLDVAVSYSYHNDNKPGKTIRDMNQKSYTTCSNENELRIQLPQVMGSWSEHINSWVYQSKLPVHIMRYEDMLEDTYRSFTGALEFLDMKYKKEDVEGAINNSSFQHLKDFEDNDGFRERSFHSSSFFRKGVRDDWKNVLSPSEVEKIIAQHSEMMRKFGYLNEYEADHQ